MGYFIDKGGRYYEGDRQGEDEEVEQRPSPFHTRQDGAWVHNLNAEINAQIAALEIANPITHRTMREFILGVSAGIAAAHGITEEQLLDPEGPHYSHAYAAFESVNAQTVALRGQKTQ
jgi:hypothetical protein